jgi:tRNA pseudouridine32 synthase/23S rRNA pseudouridine746 synthase
VALQPGPYTNLLDFLQARFANVSQQTWLKRLHNGDVFDAFGDVVSLDQARNRPYTGQGRLYYYREVPQEQAIPFQEVVLYQDAHLLVIDKPHFLPVVPSGPYLTETVLVRQKKRLGLDTLVPIHRIDRDTAGLVMLSLQPGSRAAYSALFSQHHVRKTYEAVAPWRADLCFPMRRETRIEEAGHFMLQHEVTGAANAITDIDVLEVRGALARYRLQPVSGRRHQLRVHMMALGLPILNDGLYPVLTPEGHSDHARPLQLLAKELAFTDPVTGRAHHFVSQRQLIELDANLQARCADAPACSATR